MTGDFRAAVLRGSLREHLRTPDKVHPTLPSRLIEMSFCASTANSIGRCCKTSLTKPLTTRAVASSAESPLGFRPIQKIATIHASSGFIRGIPNERIQDRESQIQHRCPAIIGCGCDTLRCRSRQSGGKGAKYCLHAYGQLGLRRTRRLRRLHPSPVSPAPLPPTRQPRPAAAPPPLP